MTELEVQRIESRLTSRKLKVLTAVPKVIRKQLAQMKEEVLAIWEMDTVHSADIQIAMFQCVANSSLTLDALELVIRKHGESMRNRSFKRFLNITARKANRHNKKNGKTARLKIEI